MDYEDVIKGYLLNTKGQHGNIMKKINELKGDDKSIILKKIKNINDEFLNRIDKNKYFLISKYNEIIRKESKQKIKILNIVKSILIKKLTDKFPKFWVEIEKLDKDGKNLDSDYESEIKECYIQTIEIRRKKYKDLEDEIKDNINDKNLKEELSILDTIVFLKNDFLKAFKIVRNDIINNYEKDLLIKKIFDIETNNRVIKDEIKYLFLLDINFVKEFYGITDRDKILNKLNQKKDLILNKDLMNERISHLKFDYKFYNWHYKLNLNEDKSFFHYLKNSENIVNFDIYSKNKSKLYLKCCNKIFNTSDYFTLEDCEYLRSIIHKFDLIITEKDINFFISKKIVKIKSRLF